LNIRHHQLNGWGHLEMPVLGSCMKRNQPRVGGVDDEGFVGGRTKGTKDLHHLDVAMTSTPASNQLEIWHSH
jgi:hypothetical protein